MEIEISEAWEKVYLIGADYERKKQAIWSQEERTGDVFEEIWRFVQICTSIDCLDDYHGKISRGA